MKKIFKKILVITCIMTLFITPTKAFAETEPTLLTKTSMSTVYAYLPNSLHINQYDGVMLKDVAGTAGGNWVVAQGKSVTFQAGFDEVCTYLLCVWKWDKLIYSEVCTNNDFRQEFPADNSEATVYQVMIVPYSTNVNIAAYSAFYQ